MTSFCFFFWPIRFNNIKDRCILLPVGFYFLPPDFPPFCFSRASEMCSPLVSPLSLLLEEHYPHSFSLTEPSAFLVLALMMNGGPLVAAFSPSGEVSRPFPWTSVGRITATGVLHSATEISSTFQLAFFLPLGHACGHFVSDERPFIRSCAYRSQRRVGYLVSRNVIRLIPFLTAPL